MELKTNDFNLYLSWPNVEIGSKLFFRIYSNSDIAGQLAQKISVSQEESTNLINISVTDRDSEIAQLIAGTLVKKFMEIRTN